MSKNVCINEEIYKSVCPGCNIGCGVYIRELSCNSNSKISIDHRKPDPVNEGKLCNFGVKLRDYYISKRLSDGNSQEDIVSKIKDILTSYDGDTIEYISIGNSTNEEHLALMELASVTGSSVSTLVSPIYKNLGKYHGLIRSNIRYDDIKLFNKIYVFCDISIQYPLLLKYIIDAKNNGSEIISIGVKSFNWSSNHIFLSPTESLYQLNNLNIDSNSLLIYDLNLYTNIKRLSEIIEISNKVNSNRLCLRPYINSTGVSYISRHTNQKSIEEIINQIDIGKTKVLVCMETDIIGISLNNNIKDKLSKLDHLVVISSTKNETYEMGSIKLKVDPLYKRYGTIINNENRLVYQYNMTNNVRKNNLIEVIGSLIDKLGKEKINMEDLECKLSEILKINRKYSVEESILLENKTCTKDIDVKVPNSISQSFSEINNDGFVHLYIYSPQFWMGLNKYNDFIEINMNDLQNMNILKNYTLDITSIDENIKESSKYKVSNIMSGFVVSWNKKQFAKENISSVSIKKSL